MPTGFTAPVVDGKITEFKDFALSCARAFGALVTMRDDPADAPIPDKFEPYPYNLKRLEESRARLAELQGMSPAKAEAEATQAYAKAAAERARWEGERAAEDQRLAQMLEKTRAWEPPSNEHVELKSFMIQQLTISMNGPIRIPPPEKLSGPEWLKTEIEKVDHDIQYHAAEYAKEVERTSGRTKWVQALKSSLAA